MKEAEKIINSIKYWSDKDPKNRTAVVILTDKKEESKVWGRFSLKTKNKKLGHDTYVAACLYAQMHITAEERDKINAVISASAEARKKIEAIISAHKKPKGGEK